MVKGHMKKRALLSLLICMLISCNGNNNISISETTTSKNNITMSTSETTSLLTTTNSSTSQATTISSALSSTPIITLSLNTIKDIKEKAEEFKGLENNVGVYESNVSVSLKLKLLSVLDAITSKTGYGDRYKILMTDGNDYIYLKTNYENYDYLKKYVKNQDVYQVNGNISLYNNEVEITVKEKIVYLENETIDVNYDSFVELLSLEELYQQTSLLKLNCKGIAFSKIVKIKAKCLAKDINNTNLIFGNEDFIINVHGHDKVTNSFTKGNSYVIYGAIQMHNFRPGLEFVCSSICDEDINFTTESALNKEAKSFYDYYYETDEDETYPQYSLLFYHPYKVTGYVNSYLKDNKEYIVFDGTFNENYYSTYQNAKSAKALFFVNENYVGLTSGQYCPLYEHIDLGTKIEVTIFPYLWNTQKYPQVYCYDFRVVG